jgi:hypothetical protein
MRTARRRIPRWLIAVSALALGWLGGLGASADAVRHVHTLCEVHQVVEHGPDEAGDVGEGRDHVPCAWQAMLGSEPVLAPAPVGRWMTLHPAAPPLPVQLGGGARAPPLTFAPKTGPPHCG